MTDTVRRFVEFQPGDKQRPPRDMLNACTVCGCIVAPDLRAVHLGACHKIAAPPLPDLPIPPKI